MKNVRIKWRYDTGIHYVPFDFYVFPISCSTKFLAPGDLHAVARLLLYADVFCTISTMGSTFVRIINEVGNNDIERGYQHNLYLRLVILFFWSIDDILLHDASY